MSKYAPTPWRVGVTSDEPGMPEIVIHAADGTTPAVTIPYRNQERTEMHARLIASAPDMLELLRRIEPHMDAITCYASTMGEHEPNQLAHDVRALLARIDGAP